MKPIVSITVAIYNVGDYLERCLESISRQSYSELEIILVDDGSTDKSAEICDVFASRDSRFKVIHKANEGVAKARKIGVWNATGRYMYIMDGDDWLDVDWIAELVEAFSDESIDVAIGRYSLSFPDREEVQKHNKTAQVYGTERFRTLKPGMMFNSEKFSYGFINPAFWDKLFLREKILPFIDKTPEKITMGEDFAFVMPYLVHTEYISIAETKSIYHYRQTEGSMIKKYNPRLKENISNLISYLSSLEFWNENELEQLEYYYMKLILYVYYNQLKGSNSIKKRATDISDIFEMPGFDTIVNNVELSKIPIKQRALIFALRNKWKFMLACVSR